jgi:eukaryotic-like serine/threonine-protein kinase
VGGQLIPASDDALNASKRICLVCHDEYGPGEQRCPKDGTLLVALASDPYVGQTIADRYAVKSLIGTGGTSMVYKAEHLQLHRPVAIKMLKAHLVADEDSMRRFEQEARAVSCLAHPHVVNIFDVGITHYGEPYIVMEFLQGISLAEVIANNGRVPLKRALHIFSQAASAVAHAHKKQVLHRDVKPSNIMLIATDENADFVKIVDFGLAKLRTLTGEFQRLTKTGEVFGSPVYMSPEQCTGKKLDDRTDVYSMGVVMFETLTGKPPFKERTSIETIRCQIKDTPPRLTDIAPDAGIPKALEMVILKALSKNPDDRYQDMDELKTAFEFLDSEPAHVAAAKIRVMTASNAFNAIASPPLTPRERLLVISRKHPTWLLVAIAILSILLVITCFFLVQR